MIVGTVKARLLVRESRSLKDKRQVVRSILDRLRNQFNVSAAEVDALDDYRLVVLGIAAVGPEAAHVKGVLQTITEALRAHPIAEFLGSEIEVGS
ncbi:DUF503 domain-containing protein [Fimbriiglobus ruber]|uniref:YlxP-like protein n=1 Tax=Fimbriiglobus ruber TaxID=1908690 RepID=A0A225DHN9_9BACT|nr:DUF503 domain-containing protein [Fimbriiglobus ruber]OWK35885.1 YlxP-like protein [Fimbriiglobus ruber]